MINGKRLKALIAVSLVLVTCAIGLSWSSSDSNTQAVSQHSAIHVASVPAVSSDKTHYDNQVSQVSWTMPQDHCASCGAMGPCNCGNGGGYYQPMSSEMPARHMFGVDQFSGNGPRKTWQDAEMVPFESFAYGGYVGPHRTPHVPEYRVRINDVIEFTYLLTREPSSRPYELYVGDTIQITSGSEESLNQRDILVGRDGSIMLPLVGRIFAEGKTLEQLSTELNTRYEAEKLIRDPRITVSLVKGDTPLNDLRDAVDARAGQGGQSRSPKVSPDGTVQLPGIGAVPAVGLTLDELAAEVNARYAMRFEGISVTPILSQVAPRRAFVLGEVNQEGKITLDGPTTVMQAIAQAGGWQVGGNVRQVIIFRRDENWRLVATKLDLSGALYGRDPFPSDEIWIQDSDIILIPKQPILRMSEAVDLYLRRTVYSIFPQQQLVFNFDSFQTF
ncbi:MAG: polysaccharide biosynthesis/export family protein [Pirellulaceae bacterium]